MNKTQENVDKPRLCCLFGGRCTVLIGQPFTYSVRVFHQCFMLGPSEHGACGSVISRRMLMLICIANLGHNLYLYVVNGYKIRMTFGCGNWSSVYMGQKQVWRPAKDRDCKKVISDLTTPCNHFRHHNTMLSFPTLMEHVKVRHMQEQRFRCLCTVRA